MNEEVRCSICGRQLEADALMNFDAELLCPGCLDEHTVICDRYFGVELEIDEGGSLICAVSLDFMIMDIRLPRSSASPLSKTALRRAR